MKGRKPFSKVFEGMGRLLHGEEAVTEEEIIMMVSEGHEQGVLEADEAEMINNIFEFGEKSVAEIMTHRKDVILPNIFLYPRVDEGGLLQQSFQIHGLPLI